MVNDVDEALPSERAKRTFESYPCRYWVAGGWAVDLCIGRVTREHADIDVLILAEDLGTFAEAFAHSTVVVKDHQTGATQPWTPTDHLEPGRPSLGLPDEPDLEILLGLSDGDDWVFHRGRRSRLPLDGITRVSPRGPPYLSPEILLLFKSRDRRDKDDQDFLELAALLSADQMTWLPPRLGRPGETDHPWSLTLRSLIRNSRGPP